MLLVEAEPGSHSGRYPEAGDKQGNTNVRLASADQVTLRSALTLAWGNIAPMALLKRHQAVTTGP